MGTILKSDATQDWYRHVDGSRTITSYRNDANLRFEIHYAQEGVQNHDFREPWANRHPDPRATGYWCRLYYGSTLVHDSILVAVDGGRALLPVPSRGPDLDHPRPITRLDYQIAKIHDGQGTLAEYVRRSGLRVESG